MSRLYTFERFLVGLDAEGLSDHAVHAAARLARSLGAQLELAHAVAVPPAMWFGVDRDQLAEMHSQAIGLAERAQRERLTGLERRFDLDQGSLQQTLRVYPGHAGQRLVERAREIPADVVFLGPHAKDHLLDFGNTVRTVMHSTERGLWVQKGEFDGLKRILCPVDLSEHSLAALESARDLAARTGAEVHALHCLSPSHLTYPETEARALGWPTYTLEEVRDKARNEFQIVVERFDWRDVPHEESFVEGPPVSEILDAEKDADLVVMGTHGHSGVAGFLLGQVTYSVLKRTEKAVLAIRHPDRDYLI